MKSIRFNRAQWAVAGTWILVVVLIGTGLYLYYSNLSGAMPSCTDENRMLHYVGHSPLLYLIASPFVKFFKRHDMAFYLMATYGFLNCILIFFLFRMIFGQRIAFLGSCFYLFFDYALSYSKQLYYATMHTTYALIALLLFIFAIRKGRAGFCFLAGISSSLMIMTNVSAYAFVAAFCVFMAVYRYADPAARSDISFKKCLLYYGAGLIVSLLAIEAYLQFAYPGNSFFQSLLGYKKSVHAVPSNTLGYENLGRRLHTFITSTLKSGSQLFRNIFVFFTLVFTGVVAIFQKDKKILSFFLMSAAGFACLVFFSILRFHTAIFRYFVWHSILFALCFSFTTIYFVRHKNKFCALLSGCAVGLYFILAAIQCHHITWSLQSYDDINAFIEEKGISRNRIATFFPLLQSGKRGVGDRTVALPVIKTAEGVHPLDGGVNYRIHWPLVLAAYRKGLVQYCLTSGYGDLVTLGRDEGVLKDVAPVASWPHPTTNRYLHIDPLPQDFTIDLYALSDIAKKVQALRTLQALQETQETGSAEDRVGE